jgi:hypothetical protein
MHDFVLGREFRGIFLEEGFWKDFCERAERKEQLRQDRVSYIWDDLIERFAQHALNATQYYTNHTDLSNAEMSLRFMDREPRLARRMISKSLEDLYTNTPDGTRRTRYFKPLSDNGPFYVFLSLPKPDFLPYEQYREARHNLLQACCMVVKYKFPEALDIVGVATQPVRPNTGISEDLLYLDARVWSDELNSEAGQLQQDLGILTSETCYNMYEREYPVHASSEIARMRQPPKVGRNESCPCGSGKKYKRCHGRKV